MADSKPATESLWRKEAAPLMLRRVFIFLSLLISRIVIFFESNHKLYPGRLAYRHELNDLEITDFDGGHLHIGEGEYGQV
jgi:hypothetical protein